MLILVHGLKPHNLNVPRAADYAQITKGCSYADCGDECPSGSTSVFKKYDKCWSQGQNYDYPDPVSLTDCHWEAGSGGSDCANANCGETEVEVDRAQYGDKSKACDWGRQKAMCCTVKVAPIKAATCSVDMCTVERGYCPATDNDIGSSGESKRDLALLPTSEVAEAEAAHAHAHALQPRGPDKQYLSYEIGMTLIGIGYPSLREMLAYPPILQAGPPAGWNLKRLSRGYKRTTTTRSIYFGMGWFVTTLDGFLDLIDTMVFPADTQPSMPNPDPNDGF
ncbi:uncharacterized protein DSM5745_07854 [Aspergillus mulundensis]|uniref:Uncharacterized protein n=1 Tax=Aspergillus mulundensis TaxID=1810919 RepID=A0A3D8RF64_9EURO|nr:hypothetical protein DSM5745_07854 [Aspergillus mulundensis]RDW72682.1 hypothetical protein DSM5745_07854 [Aspergillus mulundensis]